MSTCRPSSKWRQICLLGLLLAVYLAAYLMHPSLPGKNLIAPLGWWSWFDQGQYLKATAALSKLDFSAQNYFYPPLYSMLGALTFSLTPNHPFLLMDCVGFLLFAHYFIALASRHVGWSPAVILLIISWLPAAPMIGIWVEPWTSSIVAPAFAYLFWRIDQWLANGQIPDIKTTVFMGLLGGLVFAARPVDAVVLMPVFLFVTGRLLSMTQQVTTVRPISSTAKILALCGAGLIGPVLFGAFNLLVHSSLGGVYFDVSTNSNGFHIDDLAEKAVSIFIDAKPLYGAYAESVLQKLPWLAIALPGIVFVCLSGPAILRLIVAVAVTQFIIYLPYSDLLPTGFWKYHNVHYFKWMFPYLWLCGAYPLQRLLRQRHKRTQRVGFYALCTAVASVLLCVQFKLSEISTAVQISRTDNISPHDHIQIAFESPAEVDLISLQTLQGDFEQAYFDYTNAVSIDGKPLQAVRDFRFVPATSDGVGMYLLFIRPQTAGTIAINPATLSLPDGLPQARCYRYGFTLGWPAWLR